MLLVYESINSRYSDENSKKILQFREWTAFISKKRVAALRCEQKSNPYSWCLASTIIVDIWNNVGTTIENVEAPLLLNNAPILGRWGIVQRRWRIFFQWDAFHSVQPAVASRKLAFLDYQWTWRLLGEHNLDAIADCRTAIDFSANSYDTWRTRATFYFRPWHCAHAVEMRPRLRSLGVGVRPRWRLIVTLSNGIRANVADFTEIHSYVSQLGQMVKHGEYLIPKSQRGVLRSFVNLSYFPRGPKFYRNNFKDILSTWVNLSRGVLFPDQASPDTAEISPLQFCLLRQ